MALPKIGANAPDFQLSAPDGSLIRLSDYQQPQLICFMRHLA
ncbi:hypothetical protein [Candidatus Chlorohelix sp.]